MKLAILGSRTITDVRLDEILPAEWLESVTEVVSGGAKGVDTCAREWAEKRALMLREFLPDYARYRRGAPLKRNREIVEYCDCAALIWDGHSKGTQSAIELCKSLGKPYRVFKTEQTK